MPATVNKAGAGGPLTPPPPPPTPPAAPNDAMVALCQQLQKVHEHNRSRVVGCRALSDVDLLTRVLGAIAFIDMSSIT